LRCVFFLSILTARGCWKKKREEEINLCVCNWNSPLVNKLFIRKVGERAERNIYLYINWASAGKIKREGMSHFQLFIFLSADMKARANFPPEKEKEKRSNGAIFVARSRFSHFNHDLCEEIPLARGERCPQINCATFEPIPKANNPQPKPQSKLFPCQQEECH